MITLHVGGPAVFVLSWAIVKVFSVESSNIDGVSMNILICIVYIWYLYDIAWVYLKTF